MLYASAMVSISSAFDGGSVVVGEAGTPGAIQLALRNDSAADFRQWFYFRLDGAHGQACELRFENAGTAAYPDGWLGYRAVASYDRQHWFRVDTSYDGQTLAIHHRPEADTVYYAYFEPYSWERHLDLVARIATKMPSCRQIRLGQTLEGRDLDVLQIGQPGSGRRKIWITARQHPGETMAEFFAEGLLEALADPNHAHARALLEQAVLYVVPNMNPDGAVHGNLRTNAAGANLNREWARPTMERSPEVCLVRAMIEREGVDVFLDVHGDEAIPHNFVAGCDGNPSFSARQRELQQVFKQAWLVASPDFQTRYGYSDTQFGPESLTLASNWVGDRFDALALTIEMPFKDTADRPSPTYGWSSARSRGFGASVLQPLLRVTGML